VPYQYIEGSHKHMSGANGAVTRIVIHATCSGTHKGGAVENAHYFQQDSAGGLAHYVVDPGTVVQCCKEDTACWHAPPNHGSIGIELTDPQKGAASRWQSADDEAMLRLAAKLVVEIAHRTGVPLTRLSSADVKAGKHGICGHVNVSEAFGQSSHTDPGPDFPWAHFMDLVHQAAGTPVKAAPKPVPAPKPAPAKKAAPKPAGPPSWYHRVISLTNPYQTGDDVKAVQHILRLKEDGVFGTVTAHEVVKFQQAHSLTPDQSVGPKTASALGEKH
jgi:hypothetical protein